MNRPDARGRFIVSKNLLALGGLCGWVCFRGCVFQRELVNAVEGLLRCSLLGCPRCAADPRSSSLFPHVSLRAAQRLLRWTLSSLRQGTSVLSALGGSAAHGALLLLFSAGFSTCLL